jgi:hypothetical protein
VRNLAWAALVVTGTVVWSASLSAQTPPSLLPPPPLPTTNNPPGQTPSSPPPSNTQRRLQESESSDSGRGLEWFYLAPEGGFTFVDPGALKGGSPLQGIAKNSGPGGFVGAGMGIRLLFFTIGARARYEFFSDYKLWNVGPDLGYHFQLGNLEPYFHIGGGYLALVSPKNSDNAVLQTTGASGYFFRLLAGIDYFLTPQFSIGALLGGEVLGLSSIKTTSTQPGVAAQDGSGVGMGFTASGVLGLHL